MDKDYESIVSIYENKIKFDNSYYGIYGYLA